MKGAPQAVIRTATAADLSWDAGRRSVALAQRLTSAGWKCSLVAGEETSLALTPSKGERPFDIKALPRPALATPDEMIAIWPEGVELLVIDDEAIEAPFERRCRAWAKKMVVIESSPSEGRCCDLLVVPTAHRTAEDFRAIRPAGGAVLLGGAFAPIVRDVTLRHGIGVQIGDEPIDRVYIDTRTGLSDRFVEAIGEELACSSGPRTRIQVTTEPLEQDLRGLRGQPAVAFGPADWSAAERACLGVPSFLLSTSATQDRLAKALEGRDAAIRLGPPDEVTPSSVAARLGRVIREPSRLAEMSRNATNWCDGFGADRLVLTLAGQEQSTSGATVRLRPATHADQDVMLTWQADARTRRHFLNPRIPNEHEHHVWLQAKLADPTCILTIIEVGQRAAGVLRLDGAEGRSTGFEVSIVIAPSHYRKGIGLAALNIAKRISPGSYLEARVLASNEASLRLFAAAGFRPNDNALCYP